MEKRRGFTIWLFTGLSGSGKTTVSDLLHHMLHRYGREGQQVIPVEVD